MYKKALLRLHLNYYHIISLIILINVKIKIMHKMIVCKCACTKTDYQQTFNQFNVLQKKQRMQLKTFL